MARFRGYGEFCPVAMAAEIFAERWTPLVLRELLHGSTRFNELKRGAPLMSPSLLSQRLKQLHYFSVAVGSGRRCCQARVMDALLSATSCEERSA